MTIPSGFQFSTAQCGFKRPGRSDLGLVVSTVPAKAAGVFTTNRFQAAPVLVARENLVKKGAGIRAIVVNSGQANACTGQMGVDNCRATLEMLSALGLEPSSILPASTGVIGDQLKMDLWEKGVPALRDNLGRVGLVDMARAIMTTDTFPKLAAREVELSSGTVRLAGFCKGAGMICPNMATMLGFILCDAGVEREWWQAALVRCVDKSFNAITVDGDTSTNDCVFGLAGGASGVRVADEETAQALYDAVVEVCQSLAYMVVQDAEGGTKVMRITVGGAVDDAQAELAVRAVGHSPLVKTALYGKDANWGRIAAALGRSGAEFDPAAVTIAIGGVVIFEHGRPVDLDIDALMAPVLRRQDVDIDVTLGDGPGGAVLLASDLTHEYVSINADYRS